MDARTAKTATEVERSGSNTLLTAAARRLGASGAQKKVLQVPQNDMGKGVAAMQRAGTKGTVTNMGGTRRRSVPRPR